MDSETLSSQLKSERERADKLLRDLMESEANEIKLRLRCDHLEKQIRSLEPLVEVKTTLAEVLAVVEIMQDKFMYEISCLREEIAQKEKKKQKTMWAE